MTAKEYLQLSEGICQAHIETRDNVNAKKKGEYMTLKELSQLYWLKREIEDLKLEINALKVPYVATVRLGRMPSGYAEGQVAERRLERMDELKIKLRLKNLTFQRELRRFARFLKIVPDETTRKALYFRYVCCLSWRDVGNKCGISGDNARIICRRYFSEQAKRNGVEPFLKG